MADVSSELGWLVVGGGIICFVASFGIGANDVANSFATSVGAKTLTLRQAICIAAVFEFGGAFLMGSHVTSTIRKGIVDGQVFEGRGDLLMLAMFCALIGTAFWLLLATRLGLPVSTTHTVVGGVIGSALAFAGNGAIKWEKVWLIVASWVISPLLSGIIAFTFFWLCRAFILRRPNSLERGYRAYPLLLAITMAFSSFFILYKGTPALGLSDTALGVGIGISFSIGAVSALTLQLVFLPVVRRRVNEFQKSSRDKVLPEHQVNNCVLPIEDVDDKNRVSFQSFIPQPDACAVKTLSVWQQFYQGVNNALDKDVVNDTMAKHGEVDQLHETAEVFEYKTEFLFSYLQILTAVFDSFAHGSNDVANSIAPFAAIYGVYLTGDISSKSNVPAWILALGGLGIVTGLATWGYHIIAAIGVRLTKITPSRGFTIELGAALVVVVASRFGIPVSTTHCQVGATAAVGLADGIKAVNWPLMLRTCCGWVVTLFVSGATSAVLFSMFVYTPTVLTAS